MAGRAKTSGGIRGGMKGASGARMDPGKPSRANTSGGLSGESTYSACKNISKSGPAPSVGVAQHGHEAGMK